MAHHHICEVQSLAADAIADVMLAVRVLEHHAERIGDAESLLLVSAAGALRRVCDNELRRAASGTNIHAEVVIANIAAGHYGRNIND